jgi:hypothetical protein
MSGKKRNPGKRGMTTEWAMRTRIVNGLSLAGIIDSANIKAFEKRTGYPTAPALVITTGEDQVMFIIAPPNGKKGAKGVVFSTGSVTDREFDRTVTELKKALKAPK